MKKTPKRILIEFIFTYNNDIDQVIRREYFDNNLTEEEFMTKVLKELVSDVKNLIKISTCQMCAKKDCLKFLLQRNGKYYFNTDVNKDDDTKHWDNFRNNFETL